ncbi:hypothetical protein COCNU_scaffold012745G000010 [Cocos nucifera]|nr:hypothetical protein [Cocos nucifera]
MGEMLIHVSTYDISNRRVLDKALKALVVVLVCKGSTPLQLSWAVGLHSHAQQAYSMIISFVSHQKREFWGCGKGILDILAKSVAFFLSVTLTINLICRP